MNDDLLLKLRDKVSSLENQDASHLNGFTNAYEIISHCYEAEGTPIQKCLLSYIDVEIKELHRKKLENGKFKHIVK